MFSAPWWLPGGHVQTIYASLRPPPRVQLERIRWETPDGDIVDVDFAGAPGAARRLALVHGLEGCSDSHDARAIAAQDDEIDHLYKTVFDDLLGIMARDPSTITRGTYLLWCAHNLERIGDRVTNIAERVIFMTTGTMKELNKADLGDTRRV